MRSPGHATHGATQYRLTGSGIHISQRSDMQEIHSDGMANGFEEQRAALQLN